ncbi:MAG: c-type cytochrome [Akkermansiaceae bacterium]|nr:c-type cytochrome [Akkermansiaceae bacterium]
MTEKSEKVRLLQDTDGDGVADVSTIFADGFNDLLDGTAGGIFSMDGTAYFACVPHIWALGDADGDGAADERKPLFSGFGVRVSLSGHDLNGFALGPDGRLYGTVGDRAMNITTAEGESVAYTDQGTAFRFDPDGSHFEVIHTGLRNPKEIAFDKFGNAVSVDNNSDQGDKARLVYIVDGADSGWRTDHQNMHTFHKEVGYEKRPINQWMQERQWEPWHEGQPAFLLPPVTNITSGPSGLTYQPGTGFVANCADSFLVCDYRGGAAASGIWAFGITPDGAGMRIVNPRKFNWGAAVTDVEFGYDGALYVTDFISGWESHQAGRVYRLTDEAVRTGEATQEVATLIREGFTSREAGELAALLAHADMRVRLRAQVALAAKPDAGDHFGAAVAQTGDQVRRLHGVWGYWMLARLKRSGGATTALTELLADGDAEIRAQAARALGEAPVIDPQPLASALEDDSPRVRAFAALSLARLEAHQHFRDLVAMIRENGNRDPYLRHAGIAGLVGCGDEHRVASLKFEESPAVRLAAVVALRRMKSPALRTFLYDPDPHVADEALRAIHDVPVEAARTDLATMLDDYAPGGDGRPLTRMQLRRLTHSAFRLGGRANAARLARVAANPKLDIDERREALRLLGVWPDPPAVDQSLGRFAPLPDRDPSEIAPVLGRELAAMVNAEGNLLADTIQLVAKYGLDIADLNNASLARLARDGKAAPSARVSALGLLEQRAAPDFPQILGDLLQDGNDETATEALKLQVKKAGAAALPSLQKALASKNPQRQKAAWKLLAGIPGMAVSAEIIKGVRALKAGTADPRVALEILEAAEERTEEDVLLALADYRQSLPQDDIYAPFAVTLQGGDPAAGREIFESHPAGQCLRCHRIDTGHAEGGEAGPNLAGIGKRHQADYFLRSLIAPSADIAAGFGVVALTFNNGGQLAGTVVAEDDGHLDLLVGEDLWRVQKSDVADRTQPVSAMPPMKDLLSKRQIRDVIAWLGTLKRGSGPKAVAQEAKPFDPATVKPAPAAVAPTAAAGAPAQPDPAVMKAGRKAYTLCIGCHGADGRGVQNIAPPLAQSEWVNGPAENLIRIQLRGLSGPITVAGREYNLAAPMTPQTFQTDEEIAAVLTFVRNSFGNSAPAVTPDMVRKFRSEVGQPMLTADDLIPPTAPAAPARPAAPVPPARSPGATPAAGPDPGAAPPAPAVIPATPPGDLEDAGNPKAWLVVAAVLVWTALCVAPFVMRARKRD